MKKRLFQALVACATLFTAWCIYTLMIVPAGPFQWDEAAHALRGLLIADDVQEGSWVGFLFDTYRQVYWPPLHSWLTGIAFIFAGPSMVVARTCSLLTFVLTVPLLFIAAQSMRKKGQEVASLVVVALFLTSPPLIDFASQCMLEIPGLLAIVLTILVYFRLSCKDTPAPKYVLLGLCIAFTYFVKTNYGIIIFLAILITILMEAKFRPRALLTRANFYMILPMLIVFPVWFAYPRKLIVTWQAMVNVPFGVAEPYGVEGWIFYLRAFFNLSGSAILCALFILSLLGAFVFRRDKNVRFLLVIVLLQMIIGELHQDKMERHILPILPALFLLAGYAIAEGWARLPKNPGRLQPWLACMSAGMFLLHVVHIGAGSMHTSLEHQENDAQEYIAAALGKAAPVILLGTRGPYISSPPLIDWQLITQEGLMTVHQAGSLGQVEEERLLASILENSGMSRWFLNALLPVFVRYDRPAKCRTLYLDLPPNTSYSQSQDKLGRFLQQTLERTPCRSLVLITSLSSKTNRSQASISPTLQRIGIQPLSYRLFHEAGMRVDIYEVLQ